MTIFSSTLNSSMMSKISKPMMGSEPMTFRLQGGCSSQAELHWHEISWLTWSFKVLSETVFVQIYEILTMSL